MWHQEEVRVHYMERKANESGRDYALRVLRGSIIRLELAPGSRISENELSAKLGLSRTPVREALQELVKEKVVEVYPQRGSFVSLIDYDLVEETRWMRNVLECAVIRLVCRLATDPQLEQLEQSVKLQQFTLETFGPERLMEQDDAFHRQLFTIANRTQSYEVMTGLTIHFDRVRSMALSAVKDIRLVEDHAAILQAVRARDEQRAEELMDQHLNRYQIDREAICGQYAQYMKKV